MGLFIGFIIFLAVFVCLGFLISYLFRKNSDLQKELDNANLKAEELRGKIKSLEMLLNAKNK